MVGKIGRSLFLMALILPLCGCWKDQTQALNTCAAANPYRSGISARADVETPIRRCMEKAGYDLSFNNPDCGMIAFPRRSPYCYVPKSAASRIGFQIEMLFVPSPAPPPASR
jgi:hypothetical protein